MAGNRLPPNLSLSPLSRLNAPPDTLWLGLPCLPEITSRRNSNHTPDGTPAGRRRAAFGADAAQLDLIVLLRRR